MRDFSDDLKEVRRRLDEAGGYLKVDEARGRLSELEAEMGRPDLWDNADEAKALTAEYANVRDDLATYDSLAQQLEDSEVLHEMAREEDDESQEPEIDGAITSLTKSLDLLDMRSLFTG
ncbi:MAG: PCRF domain-containing protein, partial [Actinomycetota bacterium]|nr:PCRF domain-containing protein [Actinomycetota bacterium]